MKVKGIEVLKELRAGAHFRFIDGEGKALGLIGGEFYYGGDFLKEEELVNDVDFEVENLYDICVDLNLLLKKLENRTKVAQKKLDEHLSSMQNVNTDEKSAKTFTALYERKLVAEVALEAVSMLVEKDNEKRLSSLIKFI